MKVVSCYKAAQIAQVSRQLIGNQKKVNTGNKSKYQYFSFDKNNGEFGVDVDSQHWKEYMQKRRNAPGYDPTKENLLSEETEVISKNVDYQNDDSIINLFIELISIVSDSIKEVLNPSDKKIEKIKNLSFEKYKSRKNND